MKPLAAHVLAITSILSSCSSTVQPIRVSLDDLLNNPSKYDKKYIQVSGELILHFEGNVVCKNPDETKSCVLVEFRGSWENQWEKYHQHHEKVVLVNGLFHEENLDYERETRKGNVLMIRLGPHFHKLENASVMSE